MMMQVKCYLCDNAILETGEHIFSQCHVTISFWQHIRRHFNMSPTSLGSSVPETWLPLREFIAEAKKMIWDTICLSTVWNLWKERIRRLFRRECMPLNLLLQHSDEDTAME
jgi:hypothetical protein